MKPICPCCQYVFDHDAAEGELYKCARCGEFFHVGDQTEVGQAIPRQPASTGIGETQPAPKDLGVEQARSSDVKQGGDQTTPDNPAEPRSAALALQPVSSNQTEDMEIESLKKVKDWFVVAQTSSGEHRLCNREQFVSTLREGILDGSLSAGSTIDVHSKTTDGKWSKTVSPLAQFANGYFKLKVLYKPVWSHAMAGLKWGACVGVGVKLLDTLILLSYVNPALALMFLVAIGVCLIPRIGIVGVVLVSVMMMKYTKANFFMMGLSAGIIGAILGCLPGMAVGGCIGLARRKGLPLAKDANPEPEGLLLKTVIFPLLGATALWFSYLFVFNPWLMGVLEKP
jgi:hypothetical protein